MNLVVAFKIRAERHAEIRTATKETGNLARVFEEHVLRTIREADQVLPPRLNFAGRRDAERSNCPPRGK